MQTVQTGKGLALGFMLRVRVRVRVMVKITPPITKQQFSQPVSVCDKRH